MFIMKTFKSPIFLQLLFLFNKFQVYGFIVQHLYKLHYIFLIGKNTWVIFLRPNENCSCKYHFSSFRNGAATTLEHL